MEEAAHKETERDELLKEIHELDKQVDGHEKQLTEMDKQQKELLKNVRKETEHLEQQRKQLTSTLNKVLIQWYFVTKIVLTYCEKKNVLVMVNIF